MNDQNPFAPQVYNGFNDTSPEGFTDEDVTYILGLSVLSGFQFTIQLSFDAGSDFAWRGLVILSNLQFNFRFTDAQGYSLPDQLISSSLFPGDGSAPFPWPSEILLPKSSVVRLDVINSSSGAGVLLCEFQFRGVERSRKAVSVAA